MKLSQPAVAESLRPYFWLLDRDNGNDDDDGGDDDDKHHSHSTTTTSMTTTTTTTTTTSTSTTTSTHTKTTSTSSGSFISSTGLSGSTISNKSDGFSSASVTSSGGDNNDSCSGDHCTTTSSHRLSASARIGLALGIVFGVLWLIWALWWWRKRKQNIQNARALTHSAPPPSSEVMRYGPPVSTVSRDDRPLPPVPPVTTSAAISARSERVSRHTSYATTASTEPLLSPADRLHPVSSWNRHASLAPAMATSPASASETTPFLPNPRDPFPSRTPSSSSHDSIAQEYSSGPHATHVSALIQTDVVPGPSQSSRRISATHESLIVHQKQLELEHRKQDLDAAEAPLDPPPLYTD